MKFKSQSKKPVRDYYYLNIKIVKIKSKQAWSFVSALIHFKSYFLPTCLGQKVKSLDRLIRSLIFVLVNRKRDTPPQGVSWNL